jgi:thiamine-phosphate pyrophosphorylase
MTQYVVAGKLARLANQIRGAKTRNLPALYILTDPKRTPDIFHLARQAPSGCALIYRHFGHEDRYKTGHRLMKIAEECGFSLLVSSDIKLADTIGADGVHWPERCFSEGACYKARGDNRIFSISAHNPFTVLKAQRAGFDCVLYSCLFASNSASATSPKGLYSMANIARKSAIPVIPLGGINIKNGERLKHLGFSGIACVDAFKEDNL